MELSVVNYESPYYEQILDLRNRVLRIPLGLNLFDEELDEDRDQYIIVALKEEKVIACLMLKILDAETVKLRQMAVDDMYQKLGIGSTLIGYAENFCVLNDYFTIELNARKEAIEFYKRLGYAKVGEEFEEVGIVHSKMLKQLSLTRLS